MERRTLRNTSGGASGARAGFTLVELLVVIIIIAILAALAVPAVMRATATAQNARIKTEIDMLHQAIMQYKNEYGSFPPCQNLAGVATDWGHKHLQRIFPRVNPTGVIQVPDLMPATALPFWLSGFSDNPVLPITGGPRKKLFDFDSSRLIMQIRDDNGFYCPPSKYGSPYIYIDSRLYKKPDGTPSTWPATPLTYNDNSGRQYTIPANAYQAIRLPNSDSYFNPDSFQILCAGRDEKFGTDDDLTNFWPGTRKDYLDSLK